MAGRKNALMMFAALTSDAGVKARVKTYNVTAFQETDQISRRAPNGSPLWGDPFPVGGPVESTPASYWHPARDSTLRLPVLRAACCLAVAFCLSEHLPYMAGTS